MDSIKTLLAKQQRYAIQYRSLHLMLLCGILLGYIGTIIRLIMGSGTVPVILSLTAGLVCTLLLYFSRKSSNPYPAKVIFILFMDFLYFPLSWITSAGSLSFMPYYSILFLLATFMLIEFQYEYIFPGFYMITAIFLMYAEVRWPGFVHPYEASSAATLNLGFHYIVVTLLIGIVFTSVFRHYMDVRGNLTRQYAKDELTGLFSRSHGMHLLRQAFEAAKLEATNHTVLLLSVSSLRKINEHYGSDEGDRLIRSFAQLLLSNTRADDVCARYSGNLFMVMLNQAGPVQVEGFIHRLNQAFIKEKEKYGEISIKLLVGKAGFDYNDISQVLAAAESELDQANKDFIGGNNV